MRLMIRSFYRFYGLVMLKILNPAVNYVVLLSQFFYDLLRTQSDDSRYVPLPMAVYRRISTCSNICSIYIQPYHSVSTVSLDGSIDANLEDKN